MTALQPAYVGIGSNLGDPAARVHAAFESLGALPGTRLVARSQLYVSPPFGPVPQPDFVNAVAGLLTSLPAATLLAELLQLESAAGRERTVRWGPRTLDLDVLVYGQQELDSEGLTVPHPGIAERAFVLRPLADIAPDLHVPRRGLVRDLCARLPAGGIRPFTTQGV